MASTGQRAFVNKINKRGSAAEVRKQLTTSTYLEGSKNSSGLNLSLPSLHAIPLHDVVDPPDFEDCLSTFQNVIERDPLQHLLEFPPDDLQLQVIQKRLRTIGPIVLEKGAESEKHVRDCIRMYTKDYCVINKKYEGCSNLHNDKEERSLTIKNVPQPEYEISAPDSIRFMEPLSRKSSYSSSSLASSSIDPVTNISNILDLSPADALLPSLLDNIPIEEIDALNKSLRQNNRQDNFFALYPQQPEEEQIESRIPPILPSDHVSHRILVKCIHFKLDLEIEPIFASAALYDVREGKRISENFYFDLNSEQQQIMIDSHIAFKDLSTMSRSAIFNITYPSPDIFLVIKLEKVLQQGEISEITEPYIVKDEKTREKARSSAHFYCSRLGKFRMPFAWTGIHLMNVINSYSGDSDKDSLRSESLERNKPLIKTSTPDKRHSFYSEESGHVLDTFRPVTITVSNFFKQEADKLGDDDLFKLLGELKKQASALKKLKSIPGILKLDISPCAQELRNVLTVDLNQLSPCTDDTVKPTKEILELPIKEIFRPHNSYINLLYIYPKSLNFTNRQGSARNIAIRIQFMQGEGESHALPIIFGRSNCPEISKEYYTLVNYHNKTPSFYDEVKIKLPAKLTDAHHLFFTMYHISCQPKKEALELETVVGYSWLPLCRDGCLVTGEFSLPVSIEPPPAHYHMLHPDVQLPSMKWVDNHRGLFNVVINAVSSIHTLDEHLDTFLHIVNASDDGKIPNKIGEAGFENELKRSIADLTKANNGPLVQFVPLILDKLVQLMVRPPIVAGQIVNVSQVAFEAIANVVRRLQNIVDLPQDKHGRNVVLVSYINYLCTLQPPESSSLQSPTMCSTVSYSTLGRPIAMPAAKNVRHISSSDPDISAFSEQEQSQTDTTKDISKCIGKKLVHEEITLQWLVSTGSTSNIALSNSWFFFELIVRSMEDYLGRCNKLNASRKSRFSSQFLIDVSSLVEMVTKRIIEACSYKDTSKAREWNSSLAFFVKSCFSIMDRGFIFKLIKTYCRLVTEVFSAGNNNNVDATAMFLLKLEFVRIVCSHEHYITLNLPFNISVSPSNPPSPTSSIASSASQASLLSGSLSSYDRMPLTDLTNEYRGRHFLAGIVLSDLSSMLETSVPQLQNKAINVVANLLASHDMDPRYKSAEAKARVAGLYLPLIKIVIDILPQLFHPFNETRSRLPESAAINQTVAMAIAGSASYNLTSEPKKVCLSQEATQDLLICFLWVLKNANQKLLWSWWSNMSFNKINQLLEIVYFAVSNFEYKGKKLIRQYSVQSSQRGADIKSKMEEYMLGTSSARSEMIRRKHSESFGSSFGENGSKLRWRKDQTHYKQSLDQVDGKNREDGDCFMEGLLSNEISMIALDVIELIIQIVQVSDTVQNSLSHVLKVILHSMSLNQSSCVLQNLLATQRSLVSKFPELLFEEDTEQCADLCLRLLKHCSSSLGNIRMHASASLYMLMRQNYEIGNNFARVKMQVTMSLSSLVGQSQGCNEDYLRRSLKTILLYADNDLELKDTTFPDQVRDLVMNLHMILSDTIKMKEYHSDPEMLLDLMYRIAKGYQNSPDLRLTWLNNMATKHKERKNCAEAAQCLVHAAGLVAEYLNMLEDKPYLPVGCVALQHISRNVLEESAVSEDVLSPEEEGICQGKYFTESGLTGLLEQAAEFFEMGAMYEAVNKVYKVLIPVCENNRDFKKLAHIHRKIHEAFNNIIKQDNKRMFGTYFRVGFYGTKFGDLDGQEYIYKEPAITKLSEVSHRLESFYSEKFGSHLVEIIKDSNNVEKNQLNPDKACIQITYVEPHFDLYEIKDRQTFFEKNYNIKRFMYATPFTKDGRAHGDLKDQFKRKTILTTSHAFPYVKTRLLVIGKDSVTFTPIEVAIEDIQKKTKELALALKQDPSDAKMLQMVLQGCIGTTVNQGPVEMATVFLSPLIDGQQPTKFHNKLRSCFKDFLKKCGDALSKNRTLIGMDQKEYQQELEKNYRLTYDQLLPLVSSLGHYSAPVHVRHRK